MKKKFILNLLLLLPVFLWANTEEKGSLPYEETDIKRKSFAVTPNTSIEIINKYGDVSVSTWDKDSVRFEVTITAEASKMSTAKDLFEMAEIKFSSNSSSIEASLIWGENVNAFKRSTVEVTLAAGSSQVLRIDYKVFMPAGNTLKIENRFGDVFLPDLKGKTYISLYHGNLRAEKIKNAKSINVKYGDVKANQISEGELEVSFGDIEIENSDNLSIHSTSGTIEIENAIKLHIEGTNSKIRIENVEDLTTDVTISDTRVRKLKKKLNATVKMGDLTIDYISSSFLSVMVFSSYGEVNLSFDNQSSFSFEANMEKAKAFQASSSFTMIDDDKMDNFRIVKGKKGDSATEKVKLETKSCSVYLEITD
jgi:hypothetical protein